MGGKSSAEVEERAQDEEKRTTYSSHTPVRTQRRKPFKVGILIGYQTPRRHHAGKFVVVVRQDAEVVDVIVEVFAEPHVLAYDLRGLLYYIAAVLLVLAEAPAGIAA